jgi:thymidylate synthase
MKTTAPATFRNVSFATAGGLRDLLVHGQTLTIRDQEVRELRNRLTVLSNPRERCLFVPHRGNDAIANLAETFWIISGRNDVAWLQHFLPRAADYSDDGLTWRAAYGPRLRNWRGVDQLKAVRDLLLAEAATRRAVMGLYDPGSDFVASKDIPCNNWLHWLNRDGRLHLNIGVRSNDIVWGFSGVNSFSWSVLHEMMAYWTQAAVGEATYLASSFHIYARHYEMAKKATAAFRGISCYDFELRAPEFRTRLENLDAALVQWFSLESQARQSPDVALNPSDHFDDPFLSVTLSLIRIYHGAKSGWNGGRIRDELADLPGCDLTTAAYEYFGRKHPEVVADIPNKGIAAFLAAYREPGLTGPEPVAPTTVLTAIKRLHRQKDAAYGSAWKRRGEMVSILANVARKVDRIEQFGANGATIADESILDTAIDLFVYVTKYRLFLLEQVSAPHELLSATAAKPYSDHPANFDALVDRVIAPVGNGTTRGEIAANLIRDFEILSRAANEQASPANRLLLADRFAELALSYVFHLAQTSPQSLTTFLREDSNNNQIQ